MEDKENEERESLLIRGGKGALKGGLWSLEKYGQGVDWANDQVNLRTLQQSMHPGLNRVLPQNEPEWLTNIMDYSYKDVRDDLSRGLGWVAEKATGNETVGDVVEFGSQVILPDITDVKAGGLPIGAIPRVAAKLRKVDGKLANALIDDILGKGIKESMELSPSYAGNLPKGKWFKEIQEKNALENSMMRSQADNVNQGLSTGAEFTNITRNNLKLFNEIGFTGTNKLDIQDMLYGIDEAGQPLMSQYKRRVLKAGIGDESYDFRHFKANRDAITKDFLEGLQDLNIDPKTIHGHHISGLRVTSSLFDGLSPRQRKKLIKVFQREGLQLGNHPDNLIALHESSHLGVLHPFLEKQIGKYGQLLIDPTKIKKMNPRQREDLVVKFAKIVRKSEEIALDHSRKWLDETFANVAPEAAFRAKMDMLDQAFDNEVAFRELILKDIKQPKRISKDVKLNRALKKVEKDLLKGDINSPKQLSIWDIDEDSLNILKDLMKQR